MHASLHDYTAAMRGAKWGGFLLLLCASVYKPVNNRQVQG